MAQRGPSNAFNIFEPKYNFNKQSKRGGKTKNDKFTPSIPTQPQASNLAHMSTDRNEYHETRDGHERQPEKKELTNFSEVDSQQDTDDYCCNNNINCNCDTDSSNSSYSRWGLQAKSQGGQSGQAVQVVQTGVAPAQNQPQRKHYWENRQDQNIKHIQRTNSFNKMTSGNYRDNNQEYYQRPASHMSYYNNNAAQSGYNPSKPGFFKRNPGYDRKTNNGYNSRNNNIEEQPDYSRKENNNFNNKPESTYYPNPQNCYMAHQGMRLTHTFSSDSGQDSTMDSTSEIEQMTLDRSLPSGSSSNFLPFSPSVSVCEELPEVEDQKKKIIQKSKSQDRLQTVHETMVTNSLSPFFPPGIESDGSSTRICDRTCAPLNPLAVELPRSPTPEHLLDSRWTMYYRVNKGKSAEWKDLETTAIASVYTIESFWQILNHLIVPSKMKKRIGPNLMFFRESISPTWEDAQNQGGGMWGIILKDPKQRHQLLDKIWFESLLACIGETLTFGELVNGIVIQRRQKEDRIQLWTREADNQDVQYSIGQHYKSLLNLDDSVEICYTKHDDMQSITSGYTPRSGSTSSYSGSLNQSFTVSTSDPFKLSYSYSNSNLLAGQDNPSHKRTENPLQRRNSVFYTDAGHFHSQEQHANRFEKVREPRRNSAQNLELGPTKDVSYTSMLEQLDRMRI